MDNKEYGVKLKMDVSGFMTSLKSAQNSIKEFSERTKEEIVAKPKVETDNLKETQDTITSYVDNIKKKWEELSTPKKIAIVAGVLLVAKALNTLRKTSEFARQRVEKLKASLKKLGTNITQNMRKGTDSLKRFALRLFGLQALYRGLSKAVSAYMSYDSELSKNIQNTWAGFGSFLAPILEYIVSLFQKLLAYANAVIKAFTGINFVARANAKAMKNSAGATANASKQLSKLDEIENLNLDSGAGGGAGNNQIEIPDVDTSGLEDFAKRLKDLFEKGEYFQMGYEIGQRITEALDRIPWAKIQKKARELGAGIAEFLNGGIAGVDWYKIGNTIAQGINTALYFVGSFIENFNWRDFGTAIGRSINGLFDNIDWKYTGETLSNSIKGVFNTLASTLEEIDWIGLANDVEEFVRNTDWGGIANAIIESIGAGLGGITLFLGTILTDGIDGIKTYFDEKIKESGGNIALGILTGIKDGLGDIGIWIADNIFTPFMDGFNKAFGISGGASEEGKKQGQKVASGILLGLAILPTGMNGIFLLASFVTSGKLEEIKEKAKSKATEIVNGIKEKFAHIPDWFKTTFTIAWNNVKNVFSSGGKIFDGIKEGIDRTFKNIVNRLIDGINTVISKPFSKINSMLNDIRRTDVLGVKPFQGLWGRNPISVPRIPKLSIGTDKVLSEGLAYLHAGEKVVPAEVAKNGYSGNSNETTEYLLETLINKMDDLARRPNVFNVNGKELARATYSDFKDENNRLGSSNVVVRRV